MGKLSLGFAGLALFCLSLVGCRSTNRTPAPSASPVAATQPAEPTATTTTPAIRKPVSADADPPHSTTQPAGANKPAGVTQPAYTPREITPPTPPTELPMETPPANRPPTTSTRPTTR